MPAWTFDKMYSSVPDSLELRELRHAIVEKGKFTKSFMVVTTLTDILEYSKEEIAEHYRWSLAWDIRSIKDSLNPVHVRCESPTMVRIEFRTTFLAYYRILWTTASAAVRSNQKPRSISFRSTCQFMLAGWAVHPSERMSDKAFRKECDEFLKRTAVCRVGNCPVRLKP